MGFGLGKLKNAFKNPFKSAKNLLSDIGEGALNILTGGAYAQREATEEAKKARDQAARQYQDQIAAAEAEASRIANIEEERKRRLALIKNPDTLLGGYLGTSGSANVRRPTLG